MSPFKSKTLAAWLALVGGAFGLHRFYLYGLKDWAGWLHPVPTLLGLIGLQRVQALGQDDPLAWVLIPLGGLSVSVAALSAIVYGLTPDERWDARHNPQQPAATRSGWGAIIAVILALLVGATVLMSTITVGFQRWFESQAAQSQRGPGG